MNNEITLVDVTSQGFNAEQFIKSILQRDKLVNQLVNYLHQQSKRLTPNQQEENDYFSILKVCAIKYEYYLLIQIYNYFPDKENIYKGMANQLNKIFESEDQYKESIQNAAQDNDVQKLKDDTLNRWRTMMEWEKKIMQNFDKNQFNQIKEKQFVNQLKLQIKQENQNNYDIYSYFFTKFYKEELLDSTKLEQLKIKCLVVQFLNLDQKYPIELYQNQTLFIFEIKYDQEIKYYEKRIQEL